MTIFWNPRRKDPGLVCFVWSHLFISNFPKQIWKLTIQESSVLSRQAHRYVPRPLFLVRSCMLNPSSFAMLPSAFPGSLSVPLNSQIQAIFACHHQQYQLKPQGKAKVSGFIPREHLKTIFRHLYMCSENQNVILPQNWIYTLLWKRKEQLQKPFPLTPNFY